MLSSAPESSAGSYELARIESLAHVRRCPARISDGAVERPTSASLQMPSIVTAVYPSSVVSKPDAIFVRKQRDRRHDRRCVMASRGFSVGGSTSVTCRFYCG